MVRRRRRRGNETLPIGDPHRMTASKAAAFLDISYRRLAEISAPRGDLPCTRSTCWGPPTYDVRDLERWLKQQKET